MDKALDQKKITLSFAQKTDLRKKLYEQPTKHAVIVPSGATAIAFNNQKKQLAISINNEDSGRIELRKPKNPTQTIKTIYFDLLLQSSLAFTPWQDCNHIVIQQKFYEANRLGFCNTQKISDKTFHLDESDNEVFDKVYLHSPLHNITFANGENKNVLMGLDKDSRPNVFTKNENDEITNMFTNDWQHIPQEKELKLSDNETTLWSPLRNVFCTFNPEVPEIVFKSNTREGNITITTGEQHIDHVAFDFSGTIAAIVTKGHSSCKFTVLNEQSNTLDKYNINENITLWNIETGNLIRKFYIPKDIKSITFNPFDSNQMAFLSNSGTVELLTFENQNITSKDITIKPTSQNQITEEQTSQNQIPESITQNENQEDPTTKPNRIQQFLTTLNKYKNNLVLIAAAFGFVGATFLLERLLATHK